MQRAAVVALELDIDNSMQDKRQRTEDKGLGWKALCVQQPPSSVLCLLSFVLEETHCFRSLEFWSPGAIETFRRFF